MGLVDSDLSLCPSAYLSLSEASYQCHSFLPGLANRNEEVALKINIFVNHDCKVK